MSLVLGPVLRHVGETTAQVWVQTAEPATVRVLDTEVRTFEVAGHHYALLGIAGLTPGSSTPYTVEVDGEQVWPTSANPFPPSAIRTRGPVSDGRNRILFGSCRYPKVNEPGLSTRLGLDALDVYAARMARRPQDEWPDALLLLGDQIYADELTQGTRRRIAGRRERHPEWPDDEIVGFDEYVGVYCDAWSDPEVRWLMSTVPVAMIFDDHDVRDDWNTSEVWRAQMQEKPWWRDRVRSALASYWVYQHLGNLPPDEVAADPDTQKILGHDGDTWPLLVELADRADAEAPDDSGVGEAVRFSFRWDLGHSRLLMMDSRNGRVLSDGRHLMLGDAEFAWLEQQAAAPGQVDHLLLGTSVPWLMPHAIGDLETINEIAAARTGWRGRWGENLRQAADLEHWPAFRTSFDRLAGLVERAANSGPATVSVLSGDVHHCYAARADVPGAAVHQLTCSPVHNVMDWYVKPGFRIAWSAGARALTRRWAAHVGAPPTPVTWRRLAGPLFGNTIATLEIEGRSARVLFEQPVTSGTLVIRARLELTP